MNEDEPDTEEFFIVDTHAHLDDERFEGEIDELLVRAREAGVKKIVTVGCWDSEKGFGALKELVSSNDMLYLALGLHPHDARPGLDAVGTELDPFELIRVAALSGNVVAVGETGLDFHYMNSPKDAQIDVFKSQIELAIELKLPLIVHSREAEIETIEMLEARADELTGGVLHCFSGSREMAERALKLGFYISFSGSLTFAKAEELRHVAADVPIERMLVETDCPYLSPVPKRGKRNEPAYVVHTAEKLAEIKGLRLADVSRITTLNAKSLFKLGEQNQTPCIAYRIRDSLYLNITNQCSNYCCFCAKFSSYTVKGHYLKLRTEPTVEEIFSAIGEEPAKKYKEVVFCGFGEPLIRLDEVVKVAKELKRQGCRVRVDTDGLANLVHHRNVLSELQTIDEISISLNAPDSETYQKIVRTPFGDDAYPAVLFFIREAKKHIAKVVATAVSVPGVDMEATRRVAEDDIGVPFRVREYNEVG